MTLIISRSAFTRRSTDDLGNLNAVRRPHYDQTVGNQSVELRIFLPGVATRDIEIATQGTDLTVTARKPRRVRANWHALQLERVSADYRLHLRLGRQIDFSALQAEFLDGTLTVRLPRRASPVTGAGPTALVAA